MHSKKGATEAVVKYFRFQKLLGFILVGTQFLGIPVFAGAPHWGVDPKTAPYINTGNQESPKIVQDRILYGKPLTAPEITHEFESFKSDGRYYKTYPYGIMLNPEFSTERFHVAMKIIDHLKESGLVEGGSFEALENLMTRVVRENGLDTRAKRIQHRFDHDIQRLRDPREGIEARMKTYRGMNTTREQQQEFREKMERDFAPGIARYEQAQENNKRIKAELATEEKELIGNFWRLCEEGVTQEWERTNSNMTYLDVVQDSHVQELQGLSDEQKVQVKELGLTPHFFEELQLALGGCNSAEEVNNIIEQLRVFRGEQNQFLVLLQELQGRNEEKQEIEHEGTLLAAMGDASAENFEQDPTVDLSIEQKKKLSEVGQNFINALEKIENAHLHMKFTTHPDIAQARLDNRPLTPENETYLRELFDVGDEEFPRTVEEFNKHLEKMFSRVATKGGVLSPGLASAQEIILDMPQPQFNFNETQESMQRKFEDLGNQFVLTYNPQIGEFRQKLMQDMYYNNHLPGAGSVNVRIQRENSIYNDPNSGTATSLTIDSVSEDGKQFNKVFYRESENGSSIDNQSYTLEELQQMYNNANSNVIRGNENN